MLETRPRGEPYEHEKLCPLPLYLRGAGAVPGPYEALVVRAVELLRETPPALRHEAQLDLDLLDELAYDPRAYDHNHPADRRPNYRFGEWDPHLIDNRGHYRRFVIRQPILDALMNRVHTTAELPRDELLEEASIVLTATILMGSGISGAGPGAHDSSVTLANLMPRVARYRDSYYVDQLRTVAGPHGDRLREEAKALRQPFGGARQHLNHFLARQRAAQLQQRHLALLLAELGYPDAARRHAARVPAASLRMLTEIHLCLTTCQILSDHDKHAEAADQLAVAEDILHRAIDCGAMVDPWNILGFQGLYPLFNNAEESVGDHRIGELVQVIDRLLTLYAHLRSEAAALGDQALGMRLATKMVKLARWWDRFATTTVNDVRHVLGREAAASADHVAEAMARWRERGEATADLAFWRQHLENFHTGKSFALVVDALLSKHDYRAAMALLMNWLSQAEQVPLEEGEHSFHVLALRWMLGIGQGDGPDQLSEGAAEDLVRKFMDHLEANAEEYWSVPRFERPEGEAELLPPPGDDEEDALFGAAYEDVTYEDSTDDGNDGELLGFEPQQEFDLEQESERLEKRLRFQATVARLFHLASRDLVGGPGRTAGGKAHDIILGWLARARRNYLDLLALMDALHEWPIPAPSGSYESLVEYDRRHQVKNHLLSIVIGTCLEAGLVVGSMQGVVPQTDEPAEAEGKRPRWEPALLRLEQALWQGDAETVRRVLPRFLEHFQHEPLLLARLDHGGHPRQILRASIAQTLLRALVANLPRLGLLRETYGLLRVALTMERQQKMEGPRVTEFNRIFQIACHASVEAVVEAARGDPDISDAELAGLLSRLIEPYQTLWNEHARHISHSVLESVSADEDWASLCDFVRRFGGGLFNARFMNLGNLRGILQRGVGPYLKYLEENPDPQNPVPLVEELDRGIERAKAERLLQIALQAVVDNYQEYKDYNTTTTQSDYGENLHTFLDFLRLKAAYDRQAWQIVPLLQVHEALVKHSVPAAALWQGQIEKLTRKEADAYEGRLAELEKKHGMRLRTVGDHVRERFVQPLALDRVSALIERAYDDARAGRRTETLAELEAGLQPYLAAPIGSGLDVPLWVRRLEAELHRVQLRRTAMANLTENLLQVPRVVVPVEELREQLQDWPKP